MVSVIESEPSPIFFEYRFEETKNNNKGQSKFLGYLADGGENVGSVFPFRLFKIN